MWAPTIGVIFLGRNGFPVFSNLKKLQLPWVALAILLAFLSFALSQLIILTFNLGEWNQAFVLSPDKMSIIEIKKANLILGNSSQSIYFFLFNVFVSLFVGGLITTFIGALGEEIGWRGFLQSKLTKKYNAIVGTLVVGVIWAYWHIPANLGGINGKENILLTTFVLFPIGVVFMSFTLGWLRLRSDAIWPCAFFHGMNNALSGFYLFKPTSEANQQTVDLVSSILIGSIFIYLLAKRSQRI